MKLTKTVILACLFALISMAPAIGQETPDIVAIRGGFAQALEDHDLDAIVSYLADESVFDFAVQGAPPMDSKEMIWAFFADQFSGSPDWHTSEGQVLTNGEIVVVEHAALGTNTGESSTGPASNNPWALPHLDIYEFEGEKIKRLTSYADYAGVLMQLGLLPAGEMPELVPSFTLPDAEPTGLSPMEADIEHMIRYSGEDVVPYAKMFHSDAQVFVAPLGMTIDRDAWIAMHEMNGEGFERGGIDIVRRIDMGDGWILAEYIIRGTHIDTYLGVPASGNIIAVRGAYMTHYDADGLITHHNIYYDNLTLVTQISQPRRRIDGAWMMKTNDHFLEPVVFTAQDTVGDRYTMLMEDAECNYSLWGAFPTATDHSHLIGVCERTGPNTFESTVIGFVVARNLPNDDVILYQRVLTHSYRFIDDNNMVASSSWAHYMPGQDADKDGFPDPGQVPFAVSKPPTTLKRVVLIPPYEDGQ